MHRRQLLLGGFAYLLLANRPAAAGERAFEARAFQAAQEAGSSIVVRVHASW